MELISAQVIEKMSGFAAGTELLDSWWANLKKSLVVLGQHETDRVGMRQEHLSMRINQIFDGQVDTTVDEWVTAHADLHWGNLTVDCHLLDWEDWGAAPRGLDATYLWGASLPYPALAARVQREFEADLQTRSGKLAQLLQCANIIRIAAKRATATPFLEPTKEAAKMLLAELRS
ncbi:MAG: phosphotransferase [Pseudonocardiales bacterium]